MDGFHTIHFSSGFRMRRRGWRREYFYKSFGRGEYLFDYVGDWGNQRDGC